MTAQYIVDKQLDLILAALTPSNAAVCKVMLHTGLRISDVLSLPSSILDKKPCRMWVTEKKTGKRRLVGLPAELCEEIKAFADSDYCFPGSGTGRPKTRQAVWSDIKAAERAFRLSANLGTHTMRKAYAVHLMQTYGDLPKVQKALNHSNPTTTYLYAMADRLLDGNRKAGTAKRAKPKKR